MTIETTMLQQIDNLGEPENHVDGVRIWRAFFMFRNRYVYDLAYCTKAEGWKQYDTEQDAPYFGMWYHEKKRILVTYAEGDETIQIADDVESWKKLMKETGEWAGDPPPYAIALDLQGNETHYYDPDARPKL